MFTTAQLLNSFFLYHPTDDAGGDGGVVDKVKDHLKDRKEEGKKDEEQVKASHGGDDDSEEDDDGDHDDDNNNDDNSDNESELASKAMALGFTKEDIREMEENGALAVVVEATLNQVASAGTNNGQNDKSRETNKTSGNPEGTQSNDSVLDGTLKTEAFKLPDMSDFEPEVQQVFQSLNEHYSSQLEKHSKQLNAMIALVQAQEIAASVQENDRRFDNLGKGVAAIFGKGALADLGKDSPHAKNRQAVLGQMDVLRAGFENTDRQVPDDNMLFNMALNSVFGDAIKKINDDDIDTKTKQRRKQSTRRSRSRSSQNNTGKPSRKAILRSVRKIMDRERDR